LAAQAKVDKRRSLLRNSLIIVVVVAVVGGSVYLLSRHHKASTATKSTTTTTKAGTPTSTSAPATTTTATTAPGANAGAQSTANAAAAAAGCPASTSAPANNLVNHWKSAPPMTIDPTKTYTATLNTTGGPFTVTLDAKTAPQTVNNFVFLADQGYYHCVIFHRVIPGFMDQTGDPTGTGTGGPGYTIADEYPPKAANPSQQFPVGSVAMANTGQPHTGGSQFFIVTGTQGESLPNQYSLFGQVTSGLPVVQAINQQGSAQGVPPDVTQRILNVTVSP
jgi:cyclophilin family peptidyl-prolyl cis-trans isomerase